MDKLLKGGNKIKKLIKKFLLKRKNEKLEMKNFIEFMKDYQDDPAQGESNWWCLKHGWDSEGTKRIKPALRIVNK